jgi:hypothetical protein
MCLYGFTDGGYRQAIQYKGLTAKIVHPKEISPAQGRAYQFESGWLFHLFQV